MSDLKTWLHTGLGFRLANYLLCSVVCFKMCFIDVCIRSIPPSLRSPVVHQANKCVMFEPLSCQVIVSERFLTCLAMDSFFVIHEAHCNVFSISSKRNWFAGCSAKRIHSSIKILKHTSLRNPLDEHCYNDCIPHESFKITVDKSVQAVYSSELSRDAPNDIKKSKCMRKNDKIK